MKCKILFILYFFTQSCLAKNFTCPSDSIKSNKGRKIVFLSAAGGAVVGSLVYLNQNWYSSYKSSGFHFFDDNSEWLQMDKVGHGYSTYQVGRLMMKSMRWAGFTEKQSTFIGGTSGFAYMTAIEVMDGFSSGWGFSWGDMGANAGGSALAIAQEYFWKEQRISLKFSFHQTDLPHFRPALLGSNLSSQILKDYNGQSYWLSVNVASFLPEENKFPKWLNIALGYGANNMIGGNSYVYVTPDGKVIGNDRYRRCFLSLDVDLTKIRTRSAFLKSVFQVLNCLKVPFPTLEMSNGKLSGYAIYF